MNHPDDLKYTPQDWWLRLEEGGAVSLGITAWKGEELGEVVMAELPHAGEHVQGEQEMGVLEVLKTTFDLHAPFSATIEAVNEAVRDEPSLVNEDPYNSGWMLRLRPDKPGALDGALSREEYLQLRGIEQ